MRQTPLSGVVRAFHRAWGRLVAFADAAKGCTSPGDGGGLEIGSRFGEDSGDESMGPNEGEDEGEECSEMSES